MDLYLHLIIISMSLHFSSCWHYFTTMNDLKLTNSAPGVVVQHSEYLYGNCKSDKIRFYKTTHINHIDILGKVIIRGWVDLPRIPTCIRLQARAFEEDTFRSTAHNFQICVPRLSFCHTHRRFLFYFYEWYIPIEYEGGMDWDLYFFGPPKRTWW